MKLTDIWNRVKYGLAAWNLADFAEVKEQLENEGWTIERSREATIIVSAGGPPVVYYPTIITNPQGKQVKPGDTAGWAEYDQARRTAAARVFGINQPAP